MSAMDCAFICAWRGERALPSFAQAVGFSDDNEGRHRRISAAPYTPDRRKLEVIRKFYWECSIEERRNMLNFAARRLVIVCGMINGARDE